MPLKEILHPGFPRIGAIEIFRQNTAEKMQEGTVRLREEIRKIQVGVYSEGKHNQKQAQIIHKDRGGFKMRKQSDSPVQLHTYFDKNEYSSKINEINDKVKAKALEVMRDAMDEAKWETATDINNMDSSLFINQQIHL